MASGVNLRAAASTIPAAVILASELGWWAVPVGLALLAVVGAARVVQWRRFRWGFDGRVLRVEGGLLWQHRRALDIARIQQVELRRPILHRVLGTAVLQVETASEGGETEVSLEGLDETVATRLRGEIVAARRRVKAQPSATDGGPASVAAPGPPAAAAATPPAPTVSLLKPSVADLARSALTGSSLLVVPAAILALGEFVLDFLPGSTDEVASEAVSTAARTGVATIAVLVLLVGAIGAVAITLLRDWDIELVRDGEDLRLSRGLLDQRSATIPLHRLQVVEYRQNWLRRFFDVGTLQLRSAGGRVTDEARRVLVPWVRRRDLDRVLAVCLERSMASAGDLPEDVRRHPRAARRRLFWLWLRGLWIPTVVATPSVAIVLAAGGAEVMAWLGVVLAVTAGVAWIASGAQYRRLGHAATDRVVLVTGGVAGHTSTWMPLGRLQGLGARANPFQRRLDLVTLTLAPAGAGNPPVDIRDVSEERASELGAHLVAVAAGRVGPVDVGPVDRARPPGPPPAPALG